MKTKLILYSFLVIFILSMLTIILTQLIGMSWSDEKVFSSCQPSEIKYNSFDPYCLYIIKQQQTLGLKHVIFIGKEVDSNYGHVLNFPTTSIVSNEQFNQLKVNWSVKGIELETYYGTRLFIPKKSFTGGR